MCSLDLRVGGQGKLHGGEKKNSGDTGSANQAVAKIYTSKDSQTLNVLGFLRVERARWS